jgi:carbamate kinase
MTELDCLHTESAKSTRETGKRSPVKLAVVAFGGNAIAGSSGNESYEFQATCIQHICAGLVEVMRQNYQLVIAHGNGPQVGSLLLQQEAGQAAVPGMPLDVCGAMTQGQIGYMIAQALRNSLAANGIEREIVALVTQVLVHEEDPAFAEPTKFVGPFFSEAEAYTLAESKGWKMKEDPGRGWRRVVPSPRPVEVIERKEIVGLVASGCIVIACGGGGVPVCRDEMGRLRGMAAVVDKDFAAQTLANSISAEVLIFVAPVRRVVLFYRKPEQKEIARMTVAEAARYYQAGHFPPGSMGPKIAAAIDFIRAGGRRVIIVSPDAMAAGLAGREGTEIVP